MRRMMLVAACWLATGGMARAADIETFDLVLTSVSANSQLNGVATPFITYTLSGGAGSMSGHGDSAGMTATSSPGFISMDVDGEMVTPTNLYGTINFSASGPNPSLDFLGVSTDIEFSNGVGSYGTDGPGPCNGGINTCAFHGYFAEVPEPMSLVLLGTGMIALYPLMRRVDAIIQDQKEKRFF